MAKEVSDRVIISLFILIVIISFFGTYLVYTKTSHVSSESVTAYTVRDIQREVSNVGSVGVYILPSEIEKENETIQGNK